MDTNSLTASDVPVAGPTATQAQRLARRLTPRLNEEDARRLANWIQTRFRAGLMDRHEWEDRLVEWDNAYYNRTEDKDFPWPGAANFHVPITMMSVETFKPRLVEGVLGQVPSALVVPTTGASESRAETVETFLNWQLQNEIEDLPGLVALSAHLFLHPGLAVVKTRWRVDRVRRKFLREFPIDTDLDAIFEALFGTTPPTTLVLDDTNTWTGTIPTTLQSGGPLEVTLSLHEITDTGEPILQVLVDREEVTEKPEILLVDPIDIITPVKGGSDVQRMPWFIQRQWWDEDVLRRLARQGRLDADAVQDLLESGPPRGDQPGTDSSRVRSAMDATEGVQGYGPSNALRDQYEILEAYVRYDLDDDGIDEELIVWLTPHASVPLLGWDYLDNVYAHGRRPFRVGRFFPLPFRFLGLPLAEVIKGIQDEINAIHNQRVDYGTLQNLPWFAYRTSSTLPGTQPKLRPGMGLAVDNPQTDLVFPKFQGDQAWGQQEEALLMQILERQTGLNDLSLGRQPNRVGATRTASGTQTLLSEAGLRFKGAMTAFQQLWAGVFQDILALDQEYLPPNKEYRVTGKRPAQVRLLDRTAIRGQYEIRCAATSETLNRQRMREDATAVIQATVNPVLMQGGLIGLKGVRRAMQKFYRAYGEDPDFYLEPKAPILGPVEELMRMTQGEEVDPVQGEDVMLHLTLHQAALGDPDIAPEVKARLQAHVQKTLQLVQQMQMAQAAMQAAPRGGQGPQGAQAVQAAQGQQAPQPAQAPAATNGHAGLPARTAG